MKYFNLCSLSCNNTSLFIERLLFIYPQLLVSLLLITTSLGVQAQNKKPFIDIPFAPAIDQVAEKRVAYQQAVNFIEQGEVTAFDQQLQTLQDYPLIDYLDYLRLERYLSRISVQQIEAFKRKHPSSRYYTILKKGWLKRQAKQQNWQTLIKHYNWVPHHSIDTQCHYAWALQQMGKSKLAMQQAVQLWLSKDSRPKACDGIFHLLISSNAVTSPLAWQRFELAFTAKEIQLAKYLTRFLDSDKKQLANKLLRAYQKPHLIQRYWTSINTGFNQSNQALLITLLKRYVRADQTAANQFILKQAQSGHLSKSTTLTLANYLIHRQALQNYAKLPALYQQYKNIYPDTLFDNKTTEWLIRAYIHQADWQQVIDSINLLGTDRQKNQTWLYWRYRAEQLLGKTSSDLLNSNETDLFISFQDLTNTRSFYGFYLAQMQGSPYALQQAVPEITAEQITQLYALPEIQKAIEFYLHDNLRSARNQWRYATRTFSREEYLIAAYLLQQVHWDEQAILTAIDAGAWHHLELRFPPLYQPYFKRYAKKEKLSPNWLYATGRQESALNKKAQSGAGAIGLMQFLPTTARQVARKANLTYSYKRLFEPEYSIQLSSLYLRELREQFNNNRALASAAYNAGPHRLKQWLATLQQDLPLDAWIETIPFNETRQYVKNVLSFSLIYQALHTGNKAPEKQLKKYSFIEPHEEFIYSPKLERH